ncbi:MAG: hypothetical protein NC078_11350 [Ruminococcus sp.]|nr:hypothetical protein [Ruminococcus sp.]
MSTRERAYNLIDKLNENQLNAVVDFLNAFFEPIPQNSKKHLSAESVMGIAGKYANPDLIPFEKEAWANAAAEKYENS